MRIRKDFGIAVLAGIVYHGLGSGWVPFTFIQNEPRVDQPLCKCSLLLQWVDRVIIRFRGSGTLGLKASKESEKVGLLLKRRLVTVDYGWNACGLWKWNLSLRHCAHRDEQTNQPQHSFDNTFCAFHSFSSLRSIVINFFLAAHPNDLVLPASRMAE